MPQKPYQLSSLYKHKLWILVLALALTGGIFLASRARGFPEYSPEVVSPPAHTSPASAQSDEILRLTVREPGIYRITAQDLRKHGWASVTPLDLRLYNLGEPQPLWYAGAGDTLQLYFYGTSLDTSYTNENVYFLTTKDTPPPASIHIPQPPTIFPAPFRFEENLLYLPKAEPGQTWFWKNLTAPKSETIEVVLPQVEAGPATLRVGLFANTEAATINPDHHLKLTLNAVLISDETWDGRGSRVIEYPIPDGTLRKGTNSLTLELPGDTGAIVETILLDWVEIVLPPSLTSEDGRASFRGTDNELSLTGFRTPPLVFDLSQAGDGTPVVIRPPDRLQIPTVSEHHYFAVAPEGFLAPLSITPAWLSPDLRTAQATYIAIGPPDLLEPLQPLLAYRETQGLVTLSVPVNRVYDQFGGGVAHPEAIRHFLQFASTNWDMPPEYVLLVGDSTYDPRGYQAPPEANRMPSFFRFTFYGGETVSDIAFAQLDEDHLPDVSIGRIPARTPEQVAIMVAKTLAYEENPIVGRDRIFAIADGQDESFQADANQFLSHFPETYTPIVFAPPKGDTTAPAQINEILTEGVLFMSYFGHGSISMLGKDRIFAVEDSYALSNGTQLPIMLNITCLAGLFTHPEAESLTEAMLWNPKGGAVAALSATSLTVPADQAHLTNAFVQVLVETPTATLGQLLRAAQRRIPVEKEGVREVMETFLLFGDPALQLP